MSSTELLACVDLTVTIAERTLVDALSLSLSAGTITCILGRNGCGKTLTLQSLAGLRSAPPNTLRLQGQVMKPHTQLSWARTLAFVPQDTDVPFACTVLEAALMGRYPHLGFWEQESIHDYALARTALASMGLQHFEQRYIDTLSGGERRRLALAAALVQNPRLFLLDEPTNHLDPHHQLALLKLLRHKAESGCAVLMSLHDVNLAVRFADAALLLFGNGKWLHGSVNEILNVDTLSALFGVPTYECMTPHGRAFVVN